MVNPAWEVTGEEHLGEGDDSLQPMPEQAKISEHEDEMQMFQEETVTKTQFYEMEGTLHKQTGEILTFVEAVRQGLLDLSAGGGQFFDLVSGSRISLEKAAELGYIDGNLQETLNGHWGIYHPETKQSLSLMDAIQIGLYDPDNRQLKDIHTGEAVSLEECRRQGIISVMTQAKLVKMGVLKLPPMSLTAAIEKGLLDTRAGKMKGKYSDEMDLKDALYHGYLQIAPTRTEAPTFAITLTDAIEQEFINAHNGEFEDKNTQEKINFRDAVKKGSSLLSMAVPEIVNRAANRAQGEKVRLTVGEALPKQIISTKDSKYTDKSNGQSISFREAYNEGLICKPLTLTEMNQRNLIDSSNHFLDKGTRERYTLLEALALNLVDAEVRHIVDPDEKDVISIAEALERGILSADGHLILEKQQKQLTIPEAVREGLLTKRVRHSIFDIRGIRNAEGQELSFNEAVEQNAVIPNAERVVDLLTNESFLFTDKRADNFMDAKLREILTKSVGIKVDSGYNGSLIRAVSKGLIDPTKAVFLSRNQELSPREAYEQGLVSLRGAVEVAALFDVHPFFITPSKKVEKKKRVSRPGQSGLELAQDQVKVTLAEAMKQGLIDSRTQRFIQGDINMSMDEALSKGLLDPSSEWIVPSKSAGVGPTIEEKTTESMTETSQQLAPKFYPDRNVEESVTTVKRVKTTETSAVGGPGGVSTYRAITGGKGALEVPANGYHLYEAERKGIVDLTTGNITIPNVDKKISFAEGIELGIIETETITVRDGNRQIGIKEALEKKTMTSDGSVSGRSIEKAIEEKLIVVEAEPLVPYNQAGKKIIQIPSGPGPVISFRPVGTPQIEESEQSWSFDSQKGILVDHISGEQLSLERALAAGKLTPEDLSVRDALTGREMSFTEAEKWGIVDSKRSYYIDKSNNQRMSFTEAAQQHRIYPNGGAPDNAGDAVHTSVKVQTRTQVAKKEALSSGLPMSDNTLGKALALGWYNGQNGIFTHPDTQKQMTLKEAIIKGLFNPYDTTVIDRENNKELNLLEAINQGIVDSTAGTVKDTSSGKEYDLQTAQRQGLVKNKGAADAIGWEEAVQDRIQPGHRHQEPPFRRQEQESSSFGRREQEHSAFSRQEPQRTSFGRQHEEHSSFGRQEPARSSFGRPQEPQTSASSSFVKTRETFENLSHPSSPQTQRSSRIVEQKLQLTPFAPAPVQQTHDGRHEYVDLGGGNRVKVKVVRDEGGVEKGEYFDPNTGAKYTIRMHGDPFTTTTKTQVKSTSQVQSVELEPHAEFVGIDRIRDKRSGRIMSLEDAKRIGLARVDKKGKTNTKTYSAFHSDIISAVNKGILDQHQERISIEDAIRAGYLDIRALAYKNPKSGESIPLVQAANMGLVDGTLQDTLSKGVINPSSAERIPLQKAIELGIVDPKSGKVRNPMTGKDITWLDILKPVYQAITSDGIFDPRKGHRVPLGTALNEGLIDARSRTYHNPITGDSFSLEEAVQHGVIDNSTFETLTKPFIEDFRTHRKLNLLEAVDNKIVDPKNRTIQLSRQSIVPISKAVQDGRIPSDIGKELSRVDKMQFVDALGKGLIDVRANLFTDPDTGRQITINQAIEEGFVDTGAVQSMEGNDENNLFYILTNDSFDENSGRIRDKKTGLHLTFRDAVNKDVIDGDSLLHDMESSETLTLREALKKNKIDQDGKYNHQGQKMNLSEAQSSGLLAIIESPMQAAQAVAEAVKRRDAEGYKFRLAPDSSAYQGAQGDRGSRSSVPKFREETTVTSRFTPRTPEPALSVRMRQTTTHSPGDRVKSLVETDPAAFADLQQDFLARLEASRFDTDERIIENPKDHRRVSVREATESGLLDVETGEIIHPDTQRRYSISKAVNMKLINQDAAKRLLDGLNESLESAGLSMSPSPAFQEIPEGGEGTSSSRSWTKTVNWRGQPAELRKSKTDPLAEYTTVSGDSPAQDAPSWARRD